MRATTKVVLQLPTQCLHDPETKKPAFAGHSVSLSELVAGVGFEPTTFGL